MGTRGGSVKRRLPSTPGVEVQKAGSAGRASKRLALAPVNDSHCHLQDTVAAASPAATSRRETPHSVRNLHLEFEKNDNGKTLTSHKSAKEKLQEMKKNNTFRRKLDINDINSALQEFDGCSGEDSESDEDFIKKPKLKISELIKLKAIQTSSSDTSDANDGKSCTSTRSPIKPKSMPINRLRLPCTPKSVRDRSSARTPASGRKLFRCEHCTQVLKCKNDLDDHLQDEHDIYTFSPDLLSPKL